MGKHKEKKINSATGSTGSTTPNAKLKDLVRPHVDSFNFFLGPGKDLMCRTIDPVELKDPNNPETVVRLTIESFHVSRPHFGSTDEVLTPSMCREASMTYNTAAYATVLCSYPKDPSIKPHRVRVPIGRMPLMVGTSRCILSQIDYSELPKYKEDTNEVGGYFIVNGNEKVIRMLIYPRPNHPVAVTRQSWSKKGPHYSKYGVSIRCMRDDSTTQSLTLHYLHNGDVTLRFIFRKQEFFIPAVLLLKAMGGLSDQHIYERLTMNDSSNAALTTAAEMVLRARDDSKMPLVKTQNEALSFIGSKFKVALQHIDFGSDREVGEYFINKFIFVHLTSGDDKCALLLFMMQKLFALVNGEIDEDNVDAPSMQALLLPGQLYLAVVKDLLQTALMGTRAALAKDVQMRHKIDLTSENYLKTKLDGLGSIGRRLESFLATGSYNSRAGIDLMQFVGFVVMADRLNTNRFHSHFQAVHRGAFYTTMKTTAIRKLMPEGWGFLCPVHTPDGAPCGLLNHIAVGCRATDFPTPQEQNLAVERLLAELGMAGVAAVLPPRYLPVLLNGRVIGHIPAARAHEIADVVRLHKVKHTRNLPETLEIALTDGLYGTGHPALYLSSDMGRMVRPVVHQAAGAIEWIGALEQMFLDIALPAEKEMVAVASHRELSPLNMLSILANLTPFSDMNQSPRNMYQCQMAKHTMATPCHNWAYRTDNKFLRLVYPQRPISRTRHQDPVLADQYPSGENAVLAVISYTGYDMEDAFILNKGSVERGFAHGTMYKTYVVDIMADRHSAANQERLCGTNPASGTVVPGLEEDGLPAPGTRVCFNDPLYSVISDVSKEFHVKRMKVTGETAYVETVRIMPSLNHHMKDLGDTGSLIRKASVKLRFPRNPVIGDKFSSRHGQKGVTSRLWAQEDMPFTESGITPDCIINPCAFPSRMTIGMLVESMAGKSGAIHGFFQDCTPFRHDEKDTAIEHFGNELVRAGYRYYGTEPLYSGVSGRELKAEIFVGVCYYQRLVHQVKDKFQVRAFGPINELTHQPVHGRKRGGGIRLGEMERDSLIAHGTSMLVQDRLFNCSDKSLHYVCRKCGSIITALPNGLSGVVTCRHCKGVRMEPINVPFVLRYLAVELAAMNIRLTILTK